MTHPPFEDDLENEYTFGEGARALPVPLRPLTTSSLSLGDVEQVRLILRGGSVVDWHRLNVESDLEIRRILEANGFDADDELDRARLGRIRDRAVAYLQEVFEVEFSEPVLRAERIESLFQLAASDDTQLQPEACMLLKVMHIINHIDGRELAFMLPISDRDIFDRVEAKAKTVAAEMRRLQFPIAEFSGSRKSRDSVITKLLYKKESVAAQIYDKLRFRIVTNKEEDILPVVRHLAHKLFPFNYVVPGESINTVFDLASHMGADPHLRRMLPRLQVDLDLEDAVRPTINPASAAGFKVINFVVDLPIRIDEFLCNLDPSLQRLGRIVYVLTEFHVLDLDSHRLNEQGEASHARYKLRQKVRVMRRLVRGRELWSGGGEES